MASKENEQERREMIGRLEQEQRRLDADTADLDAKLAETKRRQLSLKAALLRAYEPPLSADICLSCWINHGNEVALRAVAHPDPKNFDRWICQKCSYVSDRRFDR